MIKIFTIYVNMDILVEKSCWTKRGSLCTERHRLTLVLIIGLLNTLCLIVCSWKGMLGNRRLSRGHQCQLSSRNHWLKHRGTGQSSANIEHGQTVNGALVSPLVYFMLLMLVSLMLFNCYRLYLIYLTDIRTQFEGCVTFKDCWENMYLVTKRK